LLKRAAELQSGAEARGNLTLREVEQIAQAAGIDAQYVRQAAGTLARRAQNDFVLMGPPSRVQITGGETGRLDQQQLSDLLEEVRRITGRQGVVRGVLDALEWRAAGPLGATYVTVRQRHDEVRVTVLSNRFDAKATIYLLSGSGGLVLGLLLTAIFGVEALSAPGIAGVIGSSALSAYVVGRAFWSVTARHFRAQVDRLFGAVMQQVSRVAASADLKETTPP
jgi:hypothetical protein